VNERGIGVLEQYDFEVKNMYKGRGFLILETSDGLKSFREFGGSNKKLQFQHIIQQKLLSAEMQTDIAVANKDGSLISKDKDESLYIVRRWFESKECNIRDERDICAAVRYLAEMHTILRGFEFSGDIDESNYHQDMQEIFRRHNREMKKTRNFMRERRGKTEFEICFLKSFSEYFEKALLAEEMLGNSSYEWLSAQAAEEKAVCHGSYNHHNAVFLFNGMAVLDFERCHIDNQMDDLYDFMRKILEKWDWDVKIGRRMLDQYDRIRPISDKELEYLKICLCYPEKYWKIANHYYNSKKSWIPDKNTEKLKKVISQEEKKEVFLAQI